MGEPARDHARSVAQVRAAAHAFAAGQDGGPLLPPELRASVAAWRLRLRIAGEHLDLEGWLLGLLTLACLSQHDPRPHVPPNASGLSPLAAR